MNAGGSVLCSNSSFSSLLSSPNTDANTDSNPSPSITLPDGTHPEFEDGKSYSFTDTSGVESSIASFSHCHFTGANYASNSRPLTFESYTGSIAILSCSFTDHTYLVSSSSNYGGQICVKQRDTQTQPVKVEASNFTNLKTNARAAGMHLYIWMSQSWTKVLGVPLHKPVLINMLSE
ncbi:hypothetical protein BLNAU_9847 [Blattamonas nauphoetae]|uniref:Uncharacterized protein n=1 Tax=Blattamonas nauphoetae TaxID=2049346 RepID=A0ABQ9XUG1_9EUKA|nr:hypothetical protein BLNAU_9847 [Blattamonas nauphoetae]